MEKKLKGNIQVLIPFDHIGIICKTMIYVCVQVSVYVSKDSKQYSIRIGFAQSLFTFYKVYFSEVTAKKI